ncbi:protein L [Frederiksenia canicola]|uniref:Protein L n=1 Tax=Frederiksenia canicola TaxID=123824 RepID=A0AAE6X6A4_9PAST|nr:protein L [Frederiksenia canicola]QIM64234.1 protein L [Frederiksenia canicola]RPE93776.1 hypothetical protein EDC49_1290 [Frederiksenia canicola]
MAAYTKDTEVFLQLVKNDKQHWNNRYSPGEKVPVSGIYRCIACGKEVTCNENDPLPPQNSSQHISCRDIKWQLIIRTDTKGNQFKS